MCNLKTFSAVLLGIYLVSISYALDTIYVDVNGPNEPGTGTIYDPFRRIQDAVDAAVSGDIIEIQPGVYTGPGNYNLDPGGKRITIRSTNPNEPNSIANTIIDPNGAGHGFNFYNGEDANCIVTGLTIRNGYSDLHGGNIYCFESNPLIERCIITNGYAANSGGGMHCHFSSPKIFNCTITGNRSGFYGGGVSCFYSNPELSGCTISNNNTPLEGGGLDLVLSSVSLLNCIITNNSATNSGGMNCYSPSEITVFNCTITRNMATNTGPAMFCQDGSSVNVRNSILWANDSTFGPQIVADATSSVSINYSDVEGGWSEGTGNTDTDPCFASFDSNSEPNTWDFHLQSAYGRWNPNIEKWAADSNTSSCIDAGDPNSDWSKETWPNGRRINMGAYGGTSHASMNGNPADFDINGTVNFADFAEFSNKWSAEESCIYDLVTDGVVDSSDLMIFVEEWLWHRE